MRELGWVALAVLLSGCGGDRVGGSSSYDEDERPWAPDCDDGDASSGDDGSGASHAGAGGTGAGQSSGAGAEAAGGGGGSSGAPYVDGNIVRHGDGSRLVFQGTNIELLRYIDSCTTSIAGFQHEHRDELAQTFHDLGINAVRLNIGAAAFAEQPDYVGRLADMVEAFAAQGIYSMVSDHDHTGSDLSDHQSSFANFSAVIEAVAGAGRSDFLIMDPYNEPGPTDWGTWEGAMKDTLDHLRESAGFDGIVVLDTIGWATGFDAGTFDAMRDHDAALRGGEPNLVFANHWYPNIPTSGTFEKMGNAADYPLIVGEIGQINPGSSPLDPGYVAETLDHVVSVNIPDGHNGVFPWMWQWCDENSMSDDFFTLNAFGEIANDHYYTQVPDSFAP